MATSGEENMLDRLDTANIDHHNLVLERNNLEILYNAEKETSVLWNKQVEDLRILSQDQKNEINDLLLQKEQSALLENEYSALLKENKELQEKLTEAEKEIEDLLKLQSQKDTIEREHKEKVEDLKENIDTVEYVYRVLIKTYAFKIDRCMKELNELQETKKKLTNKVNIFAEFQVLKNFFDGPEFKEYEAVRDDLTNKAICCSLYPRVKYTAQQLVNVYVQVGQIFGKIESLMDSLKHH